jgi:fructoselysine-6-P-deglycase FrlB-like protein
MNLAQTNLKAEIFSAPIVADELERMGKEKHAQLVEIAKEIHKRKPASILYFGSGGSSSALFSGYWAALSLIKQPVNYLLAPDIIASSPAILDENCVAIGASYSGKTVDTMRAQRWLLERKVPLFSITRRPEAELAKGATWSMTYESVALYSSPAYLTMQLAVELARLRNEWTPELDKFEASLHALPHLLRRTYEASRQMAEAKAAELDEGALVVLSGGAATMLGYMFAYDMFGEFLKRHAAFIHAGEFRHGPLEIIREGEPTMLFVIGNDRSRIFAEAGAKFSKGNGARVVTFDGRELAPEAHPLLDALLLYNSQLWLLYYMACRKNIDLDHYKYMHQVAYAEGDTYF